MNRLSNLVTKIHGFNPSPKTLSGNNIYLLGRNETRILIDSGEKSNQNFLSCLKTTLKGENARISQILLTHFHPDHVGGVEDVINLGPEYVLDGVKIYKASLKNENYHQNCKNSNIASSNPLVDEFRSQLTEFKGSVSDVHYDSYLEIKDGDNFSTKDGEISLSAIFTPGHAKDHMCFYLSQENALFTGDNILGNSSTVVEDLPTYLTSLKIMQKRAADAKILYTGHGPSENFETIQKYIDHRKNREDQILKFFGENKGTPLSPENFVDAIYVPAGLDKKLYLPACGNVLTCLIKLCVEGTIIRRDDLGNMVFEMKTV